MRRIMIAGCVLLLLAGCATLHHKSKQRDQTLASYGATLRWNGFESAWSYVDPKVRAKHPLTAQQKALYATVNVAEYDTTGPVATGEDDVEQTAQIRLVNKSSQRVYSIVDHQLWHWDANAKHWWLETGLPKIGR